ncbi:MAG: hypothetical protein WBW94_02620 [Anaerolineales bacterium]
MPPLVFTTVAPRLLEYAEAAADYFKTHGYKVYPEKMELGFPYTPTILCRRGATTLMLEVSNRLLDEKRTTAWIGYAKSSTKDTRVAICLPPKVEIPTEIESNLRILGMGLYFVQNDNTLLERIPPRDLALQIQLPELNSLSHKLQSLLGSVYEQFERSHWREGFEDVCQVLENEARDYLKKGIKSGRITIVSSRGPRNPTQNRINKMTMGQLAIAYSSIQNQNYLDAQIGKTLNKINTDRVGVAHYKSKPRTEKKLRANVGQDIWAIITLLQKMV